MQIVSYRPRSGRPHFTSSKRLLDPALVFRRERSDDFFEARIAPERIPVRMKLELAIAQVARQLQGGGDLFEGAILLAGPGVNDSQILQ